MNIDYIKLFNLFVGSDADEKRDLSKPFINSGHYVASDASILIALPTDKAVIDEIKESENTPNVSRVLNYKEDQNRTFDIKQLMKSIIIEEIDEEIYVGEDVECDECEATGWVEWHYDSKSGRTYDDNHDCPVCDGSGLSERAKKIKTGKSIANPRQRLILFDTILAYKYIKTLSEACEIIGTDQVTKVCGTARTGSVFKVGDFTIIIMPIVEDGYFKHQDITPKQTQTA